MSGVVGRQEVRLSRLLVAGVAVAVAFAPAFDGAARARLHAPARTIVSLEFDHAFTDQFPAITLANGMGMKVTVFAMSGRIGRPGYMTTSQLLAVQAAGNEIGGHTIDHPDLAQLSAQAQRHEICDDRTALEADGLAVTDFSYPYGYFGAATPGIVRGCGYESARTAGGLAAGSGCGGPCHGPPAETIPPAHPFATRSANSVLATTSLATLERYVTAAQHSSGGWVQIVFHYVCGGCDPYSIDPQTLAKFLEWLSGQRSIGTTEETVHEVLTTPFRPGMLRVSAGRMALQLRPVKTCPATPVGTPCTERAARHLAVGRVPAGSRLFLRTSERAKSLELAVGRRAFRGNRVRPLLWRIGVPPALRRQVVTITVGEPLGSATYRLRLLRG
jgi:peptidoglycan/xylan/chitin deacetylase (PgdA/CDA1 family)